MVNVLIVEDDDSIREGMESKLKESAGKNGIQVSVRATGNTNEADQYKSWAEVAFVDGSIKDCRISGFEFVGEIKRENPTSYVVLVSGISEKYIPKGCPCDAFLGKGEDFTDERIFLKFVSNYLEAQNPQQTTGMTDRDLYFDKIRRERGREFRLESNYPTELLGEKQEEIVTKFGKGNVILGEAFDANGNNITKRFFGVYVKRTSGGESRL